MSQKYALIIGNTEYTDSGLAQLTAPGKDANDFAKLLKDKEIGAFDDVKVLVNETSSSVLMSIDEFFDQKKPDDLLLLYFSGHGLKDQIGSLYLAFKNTSRSRLRSTAIKSDYIHEAMTQSRSERQVLILDCCNSGAFSEGTKAGEQVGANMGMAKAFQGYGRYVLMASDSTQFAWEGDKLIGKTSNSLFTHFLIKGLDGEADSDNDGRITMEELYKYTFNEISKVTPNQTPKRSSDVVGEIVLREKMPIKKIKPVSLPDYLLEELDDTRPFVREAVVQKLEKILKGKNIGMSRSAREALEKIINDENTTKRVEQLAKQALQSAFQAENLTSSVELSRNNIPQSINSFTKNVISRIKDIYKKTLYFFNKKTNLSKVLKAFFVIVLIIGVVKFIRPIVIIGFNGDNNSGAKVTVIPDNNKVSLSFKTVNYQGFLIGDVSYALLYYKVPFFNNFYIFTWRTKVKDKTINIPEVILLKDSIYRLEVYNEEGDSISISETYY